MRSNINLKRIRELRYCHYRAVRLRHVDVYQAVEPYERLIPNIRMEGGVMLDGVDIFGPGIDVVDVRRKVGMVFQKPNPFPKSILKT
jgi:hypothetical protein